MNIRDALLEVHSKAQAEKICNYVGDDPKKFAELMKFMLGADYRLSQRAAYPLSYCCVQRHPELIKPYWGKLAGQLEREDAHVAVRRSVARLLQFVEIPKRYQGRIFDACYKLVSDPAETVAVRCFSMSVAAKIAKNEPALMEELRLVVSKHPEAATAGLPRPLPTRFGCLMKRVVVIGSGGAGKSTFSRRLGEITGLPVIHLDTVFWRPNWEATPKEEWKAKVEEMIEAEAWIMDGNFGGTRYLRMRAADTIIMLDLPRRVCMYRIVKRTIVCRGKKRPDMAEGCHERVDMEFILWVWNYRRRSRKRAFDEIAQLSGKDIAVLKNDREIEQYLSRLG